METIFSDATLIKHLTEKKCQTIAENLKKGIFFDNIELLSTVELEKIENEEEKQIVATLFLFSSMSYKDVQAAKQAFSLLDQDNLIFPLWLLRASLNWMESDFIGSLTVLQAMLTKYDTETVFAEEQASFTNFKFLFEDMFGIKNREVKLKKIYFELINCYNKLDLPVESLKIAKEAKKRFEKDYLVVFECFKACLVCGEAFSCLKLVEELEELASLSTGEEKKAVVNHVYLAKSLLLVSKSKWEEAKETLKEALRDSPDNTVLMSNLAIYNLYLNNVEQCYKDMELISSSDGLNFNPEVVKGNLKHLKENFKFNK